MDIITRLVQKSRGETLSVSDYGQYRKTCAGRLLRLRRKLKIVTPKGRKFEAKNIQNLYAHDSEHSTEWMEYLLFSAERAWAHAMQIKSMHTAETGSSQLSGSARSHIISRLVKASKLASHLVLAIRSGSSSEDQIAAAAYQRSLQGAVSFESRKWEQCLSAFSDAHAIYSALGQTSTDTTYEDWISDNIEPSLRYAAYQKRLPRTLAVSKIVSGFVSKDADYIQQALRLSPSAVSNEQASEATDTAATPAINLQNLPISITWRGRTVKLEDARVAQALATAAASEHEVRATLAGKSTAQEKATAFEKILTPSQDAVDATKTAIDELLAEGVESSDSRMQSLQITRTALNYDLIGWRIGRNRVLCGKDDGMILEAEPPRKVRNRSEKASKQQNGNPSAPAEEGVGRKLVRLRERVALYDSVVQSIDSIRELPGVAGDASLLKKLVTRKAYFSALRSVAVARSHAVQGSNKIALAMFARAAQHAKVMDTFDDDERDALLQIPRQFVVASQAGALNDTISGLVVRFRALVEMDNLESEASRAEKTKAAWAPPLIERMDEYPSGGADLTNLVTYPPKLRPVPVKPIFLDLAWNYIQYPDQARSIAQVMPAASEKADEKKAPAKKGWFGFGRS